MSSCTNTFRNLLPLWTSNVWPTNSGMIVHARAQVLMGCLARFSLSLRDLLVELLVDERAFFCASAHVSCPSSVVESVASCSTATALTSYTFTVCGRCWCLPNLRRRRISFSLCFLRAAGDAALGRHAGLADRVTSAVAAAFAAAQRMVDRVHRLGTGVRADAHVAAAAGLADADVDPVEVAELADRRAALALRRAAFRRTAG